MPEADAAGRRSGAIVAVTALAVVLLGGGAAGAYVLARAWRAAAEREDEYAWSAAKREADAHARAGDYTRALEAIDSFRARAKSDRYASDAMAMRTEIAATKVDAEMRILAEQQKRVAYGEKLARAKELVGEKEYDEAIVVLEEAIAILPEDPGAQAMIATVRRAKALAVDGD